MRSRICLLVVSIALTLLVCEGLSRLWLDVRSVGPAFSQFDPVLGKVLKKNFSTTRWTPEFTMRFSTNSMGNRGPEPKSDMPSDAPVILFVGNSFTEGYGVDDGDEFPQLVAKRLKDLKGDQQVRIINAGIGDTGTGRALRLVRDFAPKEAGPTLLVLEIMANDFDDNDRDGFFFINSSGVIVERNQALKPSMLQKMQPLFEKIPGLSQSHFFAATQQVLKTALAKHPPAQEDESVRHDRQRSLLLKLVNEILELARGRGWSAVVMTVELSDQDNEIIQAVASRFGAKMLIVPSKARRPDLYYVVDGHWNKAGHEYVAAALRPIVEQELGLGNATGH